MISFNIIAVFPCSASRLYNHWLDSKGHAKMTGGEALCSEDIGGSFSAWDGYISGTNISLEKNKRIVQSWRTTEFPENARSSVLELIIEDLGEECSVLLKHSEIPEGQPDYKAGWEDYYFRPMKAYFSTH